MTLHPLANVFEAMMEKGQDQIPDEEFLMTKMPNIHPNPKPNPTLTLTLTLTLILTLTLKPNPNLNHLIMEVCVCVWTNCSYRFSLIDFQSMHTRVFHMKNQALCQYKHGSV